MMFLTKRKPGIFLSLFLFILLSPFVPTFAQYTISSLPSPKDKGQDFYVSNPNGVLSFSTETELNQLSTAIEKKSGAEYAVVVVNDIEGYDVFDFALQLFNKWGIGKKGANNGLLLFIAKDRREYRFISGYGMESLFPDAYLHRMAEKYLVPNFREGDYDRGVLEASRAIQQALMAEDVQAELASMMPETAPFWSWSNPILKNTLLLLVLFSALYLYVHKVSSKLIKDKKNKPALFVSVFYGMGVMLLLMFFTLFIFLFVFNNLEKVYQIKNLPYFVILFGMLVLAIKINDGKTRIQDSYKDEEDLQKALKKFFKYIAIPILLTPLAWFEFFGVNRRFQKNQGRFVPPDDSGDWERVNRSSRESSRHLDKGQKNEEAVGGLRYEIWKNKKTNEYKLVAWDKSTAYGVCPKCGYYTLLLDKSRTVIGATYSSTGEGEWYDECRFCGYQQSTGVFIIPQKTTSSGSSSSSGGGSSSSSSSGGGGSFGGGSSGGGGAGGKW